MLIAYKAVVIIVFCVFAFFISDFGNKAVKPLIKQPWLSLMRLSYPIAPICFIYFLVTATKINYLDYIALVFLITGTLIVVAAKRNLGARHSWTGYSSTNITEFCHDGIYSWIRHPLYTGIFIAVTGTALVVIPRYATNPVIFAIYIIGAIFTFTFITISSKKETEHLTETFGEKFKEYVNYVHPFLPLRSYKNIAPANDLPTKS